MTLAIVSDNAETKQSHTPTSFFSLSAEYEIAANATDEKLSNDLGLLLDCGINILKGEGSNSELSSAQWGAVYLLEQAFSISEALNVKRLRASGKIDALNAEIVNLKLAAVMEQVKFKLLLENKSGA